MAGVDPPSAARQDPSGGQGLWSCRHSNCHGPAESHLVRMDVDGDEVLFNTAEDRKKVAGPARDRVRSGPATTRNPMLCSTERLASRPMERARTSTSPPNGFLASTSIPAQLEKRRLIVRISVERISGVGPGSTRWTALSIVSWAPSISSIRFRPTVRQSLWDGGGPRPVRPQWHAHEWPNARNCFVTAASLHCHRCPQQSSPLDPLSTEKVIETLQVIVISGARFARGPRIMKHALFSRGGIRSQCVRMHLPGPIQAQRRRPSSPSVTLTTETLTGTVPVGGSDAHNIVLSQAGQLDVTLTAAGPPSTIFMGLGIGTLSGSSCVFLSGATTNVQAGASPQLSGSAVAAGTYCVAVYDIGNEAAPVTYSLTVVHS